MHGGAASADKELPIKTNTAAHTKTASLIPAISLTSKPIFPSIVAILFICSRISSFSQENVFVSQRACHHCNMIIL
jgi:hypothetical protein